MKRLLLQLNRHLSKYLYLLQPRDCINLVLNPLHGVFVWATKRKGSSCQTASLLLPTTAVTPSLKSGKNLRPFDRRKSIRFIRMGSGGSPLTVLTRRCRRLDLTRLWWLRIGAKKYAKLDERDGRKDFACQYGGFCSWFVPILVAIGNFSWTL